MELQLQVPQSQCYDCGVYSHRAIHMLSIFLTVGSIVESIPKLYYLASHDTNICCIDISDQSTYILLVIPVTFQSSTTRLIYAYGDSDPVDSSAPTEYHGSDNRGAKSVYLLETNTPAPSQPQGALIYEIVTNQVRPVLQRRFCEYLKEVHCSVVCFYEQTTLRFYV